MLGPAGTGRLLWGIEQGGAGCSPILNSIYCEGVVVINSIVGKSVQCLFLPKVNVGYLCEYTFENV